MQHQNSRNISGKYKKYPYALFYTKDTGELYAYTDNKTLARAFRSTRKESIFIMSEKMLSPTDLREIHDELPDTLLEPYKFEMGDTNIVLPITMREKLELEHVVSQTIGVNIYLSANINPNIFTEKVQEILKRVKYVDVYNEYHSGKYRYPELKADYLTCFLTLYGETIRKRW